MAYLNVKKTIERKAAFSPRGKCRFVLWRSWSGASIDGPYKLCWIMLNPSWANDDKDDNTIRQVISFSDKWKYKQAMILNLSPRVDADPKSVANKSPRWLFTGVNQHFLENRDIFNDIELVICAWGAAVEAKTHKKLLSLGLPRIRKYLPPNAKYKCLGKTQNLSPRHPRTVKLGTARQKYTPPT